MTAKLGRLYLRHLETEQYVSTCNIRAIKKLSVPIEWVTIYNLYYQLCNASLDVKETIGITGWLQDP